MFYLDKLGYGRSDQVHTDALLDGSHMTAPLPEEDCRGSAMGSAHPRHLLQVSRGHNRCQGHIFL